MIMDAAKISEIIRMKKKKMMSAEPALVDTDSELDMNPLDHYDMEQKGRVEETLDSPHKINADDTMMDESYSGVGISPDEKKRMARLRTYMDSVDLY